MLVGQLCLSIEERLTYSINKFVRRKVTVLAYNASPPPGDVIEVSPDGTETFVPLDSEIVNEEGALIITSSVGTVTFSCFS